LRYDKSAMMRGDRKQDNPKEEDERLVRRKLAEAIKIAKAARKEANKAAKVFDRLCLCQHFCLTLAPAPPSLTPFRPLLLSLTLTLPPTLALSPILLLSFHLCMHVHIHHWFILIHSVFHSAISLFPFSFSLFLSNLPISPLV
jgi:hypothetical protein